MTISILHVDYFGLHIIKSVPFFERIKEHGSSTVKPEELHKWLTHRNFDRENETKFEFHINDNLDICVKMTRNNLMKSIYYYESGDSYIKYIKKNSVKQSMTIDKLMKQDEINEKVKIYSNVE